MNSSRILLILILTNTACGLTQEGDEKFQMEKLDDKENIILENLGQAQLFHEEWKLVIGFDYAYIESDLNKIEQTYHKIINELCLRISKRFVCSSRQRLYQRINSLKNVRGELRNTFHLTGLDNSNSSRVKRGLFDFIGEISKTLFGTLDATDAEYYNNELDKLYNDQKEIMHYVNNQTSIILSSLSSSISMLNKSQDQIIEMNERFNKVKDLTKTNEMNIQINELILDLDMSIIELRDRIRKIEELAYDAKHGLIKPYILAPEKLFEILRTHEHVKNFPVELKEQNYLTLIDVCTISAMLNGKRILIELKIPLLENKVLNLQRIITLPTYGWFFHSIIDTRNQMIMLDPIRMYFIPISQLEN